MFLMSVTSLATVARLIVLFSLPGLLGGCAAGMDASQKNIDFGKVLIGASSPSVGVHWTNNSMADVYAIAFWDAAVAPFASTVPADQMVNPGASTGAATVTFTPTAVGRAESRLRPRTAPHASDAVRLRGEGVTQFVE